MIVLAHGVLSSHSKSLCTLTIALEPPLTLALSTKTSCDLFPLTGARYGVVVCTDNHALWDHAPRSANVSMQSHHSAHHLFRESVYFNGYLWR